MSIEVSCPGCGESDRARLSATRTEDDRIFITCGNCDHHWERVPDRCPECGHRPLSPRRVSLLQKARGTQQSVIGFRIAQDCLRCGWSSEGPERTSAI